MPFLFIYESYDGKPYISGQAADRVFGTIDGTFVNQVEDYRESWELIKTLAARDDRILDSYLFVGLYPDGIVLLTGKEVQSDHEQ